MAPASPQTVATFCRRAPFTPTAHAKFITSDAQQAGTKRCERHSSPDDNERHLPHGDNVSRKNRARAAAATAPPPLLA
jgi:hypothetical protein